MASLAALAELLPGPGEWNEASYHFISERGRLVELSDGNIEVLPVPAEYHQLLAMRLAFALHAYAETHQLGQVRFAPLPVRLWAGKIREPDIMYMSNAHLDRIGEYWGVPDLAVEIVSEGGEIHDTRIKRAEYAHAGIGEYWIVDPAVQTIELLTLNSETGSYNPGTLLTSDDTLASLMLRGFSLSLAQLFAPARSATPSK